MKESSKIIIFAVLGYIPFSVLFGYGFFQPIQVGLESISGVMAANGIILGFWAAIIVIPANSKLRKNRNLVETGIIFNLATLIGSVFSVVASFIGIISTWGALSFSVMSFYLVCWALGITLHYTIFHAAVIEKVIAK